MEYGNIDDKLADLENVNFSSQVPLFLISYPAITMSLLLLSVPGYRKEKGRKKRGRENKKVNEIEKPFSFSSTLLPSRHLELGRKRLLPTHAALCDFLFLSKST